VRERKRERERERERENKRKREYMRAVELDIYNKISIRAISYEFLTVDI